MKEFLRKSWFRKKVSRQQQKLEKLPFEPGHEISNNLACATSKASDQPAHTRSLIRAFASRLSILWLLSYWLNTINFGVSKHNRRLRRLVRVYTCQNVKLLEISFHGSIFQNYVWTVTVYSKQTYHLLISFANNLNPDQTRHSVGLLPGTLMFYLKTFSKLIWKISEDENMHTYSACKRFISLEGACTFPGRHSALKVAAESEPTYHPHV